MTAKRIRVETRTASNRRATMNFKPELWAGRDPTIIKLWGVETIAAIARRIGCDPHDIAKRSIYLGLDQAAARVARCAAQSRIASERAKRNHEARRQREAQQEDRGEPLRLITAAKDGAKDVRAAVRRAPVSAFDLGRLAA
jgi:hypothetical protein